MQHKVFVPMRIHGLKKIFLLVTSSIVPWLSLANDDELKFEQSLEKAKYILIGKVSAINNDVKRVNIVEFLKGEEVLGSWKEFRVVERNCMINKCLAVGDKGVFFIASADEGFVRLVEETPYALFTSETLPVIIEVMKDVSGLDGSHAWQKKGNLYSNRAFRINKGERFQMIEVIGEGECKIRYRENEYHLSSCPWLPGFTDHQSETFLVVPPN